ncbi:MAG: radical SAM protein [Lachnospiraceae bacterium]|nr:radical SAM protein [Lachnospiraceae bacterium]
MFIGDRKEHLKKFLERGLIEEIEEPSVLSPEQEYHAYDNRFIQMVHWSMTGHCNYRCRHCYMSAPHAVLPEPDGKECKRIIDEMVSCGIHRVSLTGGEALVRKDFLSLVDYMLERGIRIATIMSNGALVSEKLLTELEKRNCRPEFNMSYDGTEGWHDWLRGINGAEKAVEKAFLLCRDHGFPTGSEFCLHRGNAGTLRDSVNKLAKWGVKSLKVARLCTAGEALAIREQALSCKEEYDIYMEYVPRYYEDGMPIKNLMLSGLFGFANGEAFIPMEKGDEESPNDRQPVCRSARLTMYLGPDGRILPCIPMSETQKSQEYFPIISDMTLKEALTDSSYLSFIRTDMKRYLEYNPKCAACEYKYRCSAGCRGRAAIDSDGADLLALDKDACLFYLGGYYKAVKELISQYPSKA